MLKMRQDMIEVWQSVARPILLALSGGLAWVGGTSTAHWLATRDPDVIGLPAGWFVALVVLTVLWLVSDPA